jgi:RNA polymerase sigma-70 factor (ECF subfamily)
VKLTKSTGSPSAEDERDLFKRLFKQHASGIYRLANAQLHSRVEAQEIVQECFLKFWEKRHEVSSDLASIKSYLYTSAYHAILNQVRRQHNWVYQDYADDLVLEQAPQLASLEYQELDLCYTHALAQLPTKRREIFTLSRQQGLSNAMIAQELNISVKTVEAQMTQALKFIRQYFVMRGVLPALVTLLVEALSC